MFHLPKPHKAKGFCKIYKQNVFTQRTLVLKDNRIHVYESANKKVIVFILQFVEKMFKIQKYLHFVF